MSEALSPHSSGDVPTLAAAVRRLYSEVASDEFAGDHDRKTQYEAIVQPHEAVVGEHLSTLFAAGLPTSRFSHTIHLPQAWTQECVLPVYPTEVTGINADSYYGDTRSGILTGFTGRNYFTDERGGSLPVAVDLRLIAWVDEVAARTLREDKWKRRQQKATAAHSTHFSALLKITPTAFDESDAVARIYPRLPLKGASFDDAPTYGNLADYSTALHELASLLQTTDFAPVQLT